MFLALVIISSNKYLIMMREEELLIDVTSSADVVRIFPLFIMLFSIVAGG